MTLELGVLVSGSGTNLQAILDATESGKLDARVRLVISNKPDVPALERAKRAGVAARCISHRQFSSRESFDDELVRALGDAGADWVVLAGFMRLLTPRFLRAFPGRVLNIHPALLPAFPGTRAQEQALDYGVKITGCTVHFVDEGVDTGPIIAQRSLAIDDEDDVGSLTARLLSLEHALLVDVLGWLAADRVRIEPGSEGRRPRVVVRRE